MRRRGATGSRSDRRLAASSDEKEQQEREASASARYNRHGNTNCSRVPPHCRKHVISEDSGGGGRRQGWRRRRGSGGGEGGRGSMGGDHGRAKKNRDQPRAPGDTREEEHRWRRGSGRRSAAVAACSGCRRARGSGRDRGQRCAESARTNKAPPPAQGSGGANKQLWRRGSSRGCALVSTGGGSYRTCGSGCGRGAGRGGSVTKNRARRGHRGPAGRASSGGAAAAAAEPPQVRWPWPTTWGRRRCDRSGGCGSRRGRGTAVWGRGGGEGTSAGGGGDEGATAARRRG